MPESKIFRVLIGEQRSFYVNTEATSADEAMETVRRRLRDPQDNVQPIEDYGAYEGYQVEDAIEIARTPTSAITEPLPAASPPVAQPQVPIASGRILPSTVVTRRRPSRVLPILLGGAVVLAGALAILHFRSGAAGPAVTASTSQSHSATANPAVPTAATAASSSTAVAREAVPSALPAPSQPLGRIPATASSPRPTGRPAGSTLPPPATAPSPAVSPTSSSPRGDMKRSFE